MPRPPSERLLDAVTSVLLEDGFEGVSVRKVAARAGVSIGAVQHHFPTKDAMLMAAMERASLRFQQRLATELPAEPTAEQALRAVSLELLGAGPDRHADTVIWTQRLARAMVDPQMQRRHAQEWQEVEDLITRLLRAARPRRPPEWAKNQAGLLVAVLDGLAVAQVAEPDRMPAARAQQILAGLLESTLAD